MNKIKTLVKKFIEDRYRHLRSEDRNKLFPVFIKGLKDYAAYTDGYFPPPDIIKNRIKADSEIASELKRHDHLIRNPEFYVEYHLPELLYYLASNIPSEQLGKKIKNEL